MNNFFKYEPLEFRKQVHCFVLRMPTTFSFASFLVIHLQAKLALGGDRCRSGLSTHVQDVQL